MWVTLSPIVNEARSLFVNASASIISTPLGMLNDVIALYAKAYSPISSMQLGIFTDVMGF